jgi:hypothetical protein
MSKSMTFSQVLVQFSFYVENSSMPSQVIKSADKILIRINSIEFYHILKESIDKYRTELMINDELQQHFIDAWLSLETVQDKSSNKEASSEVEQILEELKECNKLNLFSD